MEDDCDERLSCRTRSAYGFSFVAASLCSKTVNSYVLVFFHHILHIENDLTGYIIFTAKVTDAIITLFVAVLSDKFNGCCCYPKWKSVHLIGK